MEQSSSETREGRNIMDATSLSYFSFFHTSIVNFNMMFSRLSLLAALITTPFAVDGAGGSYSYDPTADNGPAFWSQVVTTNPNQCDGLKNSPVALSSAEECDLYEADYTFVNGDCLSNDFDYFSNDHVAQAVYPADGSCEKSYFYMPGIDGKFVVEQLHIHTSTEHSLDGNLSDFELHGVHRLEEGTGEQEKTGLANANAVFGIRITAEAGAEDNEAFQPLLDGWQVYFDDVLATGICQNVVTRQGGTRRKLQVGVFNIYDLVPDNLEYFFHYDGSLTTPPCSEAVWWNVANEPVIISEAQKEQLNTLILEHRNEDTCELATVADPATGSTSRATQDLNGRSVSTYCLDAGTISLNTGVTSSSMTKSLLGPVAIVSAALALF